MVDWRIYALGSAVFAAASIALFTTYFIVGAGAGGDEPASATPWTIEPSPDGFTLRF